MSKLPIFESVMLLYFLFLLKQKLIYILKHHSIYVMLLYVFIWYNPGNIYNSYRNADAEKRQQQEKSECWLLTAVKWPRQTLRPMARGAEPVTSRLLLSVVAMTHNTSWKVAKSSIPTPWPGEILPLICK